MQRQPCSAATIRRCVFVGLAVALEVSGSISVAEAKWTSVDVTGSFQTTPVAISDKEVVAGSWIDNDGIMHGFVRAGDGGLTSFDAADGVNTQVLAINNRDAVTGYYSDFSGDESGFIRDRDGTITSFVVPDTINTTPSAINGNGVVAGYAYSEQTEAYIGFSRTARGRIRTFQVPKATETYGYAVDDSGDIAGAYADTEGSFHGFLRTPDGKFARYSIPGVDAIWLVPAGIDSGGDIAGTYAGSDYVSHCYLRKADGTIVKLDRKPWTFCQVGSGENGGGINGAGAIAGAFTDKSGNHGFLMLPDGGVKRLDYPGGEDETIPVGINAMNRVTGYYLDSAFEGFVWK